MIETSDAEWVARCRKGDERAFEALVVKYQKVVYNLALRMSHRRIVAEEVTQAVFVKIFEKLDSYKSDYPFFSWLYRIAMNESINEMRSTRRRYELDETQLVAESEPSFELIEGIQAALLQLQPKDRALIILRHFHNLGYQEIAYIVDLSESQVKAHLFTARRSLKQILSRMGIKNEN